MGQQYSVPEHGTQLKVIGAGLPRTGTASFSRALEILLKGPVYHGGTQVTLGPPHEIKSWIKVMGQWPPPDESTHAENLATMKARLDGFVAVTDSPGCSLFSELLEVYPDAKVICTVRDVDSWEKSMATVANASTKWFLRALFLPMPTLRHFVDYINALRDHWYHNYGEIEPVGKRTYNRHIEWLQESVPADRLVFFDVKDGWEPLCAALGVPVPDEPFPHINDSDAIEEFSMKQVNSALKQWAKLVVAASIAGLSLWVARRY